MIKYTFTLKKERGYNPYLVKVKVEADEELAQHLSKLNIGDTMQEFTILGVKRKLAVFGTNKFTNGMNFIFFELKPTKEFSEEEVKEEFERFAKEYTEAFEKQIEDGINEVPIHIKLEIEMSQRLKEKIAPFIMERKVKENGE